MPSGIFEIPIDEDDIILEDAGPALELDDGSGSDAHGSLDEAFAAAVEGNEFDDPDDIALEIDSLDEGTDVGEAARSVLPKTPLFSDLSPAALQRIIGGVELVELSQGEAVFSQGDVADAFYVVSEGAVAAIDEGPPRMQLGIGPPRREVAGKDDQVRVIRVYLAQDPFLSLGEAHGLKIRQMRDPQRSRGGLGRLPSKRRQARHGQSIGLDEDHRVGQHRQ